jgi:hypothetical protein
MNATAVRSAAEALEDASVKTTAAARVRDLIVGSYGESAGATTDSARLLGLPTVENADDAEGGGACRAGGGDA